MPDKTIKDFSADFAAARGAFESFSIKLEKLLKDLLDDAEIKYHLVESRAKTLESFIEKIKRPGKSYREPLTELPDLCGCRIIVFYADDVGKVAELICKELDILEKELSHQPNELDVDRFGYLSIHYVVRLGSERARLAEWRSVRGLHAEIQVRTVIQHAWSAVSHALQYKREASVPSALRRRLHRIAGIFELADEEFVGIRDQRTRLEVDAADKIAQGEDLILTSTNISETVRSWQNADKYRRIAEEVGFGSHDVDDDYNMIPDIYELATRAGIKSTKDLIRNAEKGDASIFSRLPESSWTADNDFLLFLLLLSNYPSLLTLEDFVRNGWFEELAKGVIEAAHSTSR